jgi:hypothetical protein
MLIDVAISGDRNVIKKEAEKTAKYKDLIIENRHIWNVKAKVIPVTTGANWNHFKITQTIPKPYRESMKSRNCKSHIGHCTHTAGSANLK